MTDRIVSSQTRSRPFDVAELERRVVVLVLPEYGDTLRDKVSEARQGIEARSGMITTTAVNIVGTGKKDPDAEPRIRLEGTKLTIPIVSVRRSAGADIPIRPAAP